MHVKYYRFFV